jgi:hypothetical protein
MLMNTIQNQAPIVSYTEIANQHVLQSPAIGFFDGNLSGEVTSSVGVTGAVTLNAKYTGWKIVGVRYIRNNYNNTVKAEGIKDLRIDVMNESGVFVPYTTVRFPYGEYNSLVEFMNNPTAPIIINSKRQIRIVAVSAWSGVAIRWLEVQFVVGYA